ncbi:MAG: DUF3822 family protein [Tannerellaceae bacterium]|jgi:hypothetical protein|nr:DUF3822 family protein [Tannerellaceae bacterium]
MTISIPDTFTINHSEKYIMSIRLWPGGLSFSAYNPYETKSYIFRNINFDRNIPYSTSLKETFFANECLIWPYKRTYVLSVTPHYTLIPDELFSEKQKNELLRFNFTSQEKHTLSDSMGNEEVKIVYDMEEEVYEFCSRSLTNPIYVNYLTPQLIVFQKQSLAEKFGHMFVVIHENIVDISCFSEGNLSFVNSFVFDQSDDNLLYYILYIWRQMKMDQLHDRLSLAGDSSLCSKLTQSLQVYLQHVKPIEIPSEAYLMGGEILQAPMDLLLLSVCGL